MIYDEAGIHGTWPPPGHIELAKRTDPLSDRLFVGELKTKLTHEAEFTSEGWTIFDRADCNGLRSTFQPTTKALAEAEMARRIADTKGRM